jgi:hypothetical protein
MLCHILPSRPIIGAIQTLLISDNLFRINDVAKRTRYVGKEPHAAIHRLTGCVCMHLWALSAQRFSLHSALVRAHRLLLRHAM